MYFVKEPKYMFIAYTVNYEYNTVDFRIKFSVPFFTKEDAESYKQAFVNNLQDTERLLFAIIPLVQE